MAIVFNVGFFLYEVGTGDFLHSFFSTVAYNLESKKWGSKYPVLMNEFYQGRLEPGKADDAIKELKKIKKKLKKCPVDHAVWDIDDLSKQPPQRDAISSAVTDLSNYFVTSDGEDFITILMHALEKAKEMGWPIEIESIGFLPSSIRSVGLNVGDFWYEVGAESFLHSFFSTVAYNLESKKWGSKYPVLMNEFYQGSLEPDKVDAAIGELQDIKKNLKKCPVDHAVWDIDDLSKQPPWGNDISSDITDLSNYFVTSDGEDFIAVLMDALEKAKEIGLPIEIE